MNRHERRRMFALGMHAAQTGELPEHYVNVIKAIADTYRAYPTGEELPRFAFGPPEIMVVASLEHMVDRIALNTDARVFLDAIVLGAEAHPEQQRCPCGWFFPRETFVEQLTIGPPVARVRMVILCPICGTRADVEVGASARA